MRIPRASMLRLTHIDARRLLVIASAYLAALLLVGGSVFLYYHPYRPVTFDSATTCHVCKIALLDEIQDIRQETGRPVKVGPRVCGDRWAIGQPALCSEHITTSVKHLLHDRMVYGRHPFTGGIYLPHFAFLLTGASGTEIVVVDIQGGVSWFSAIKLDATGRPVAEAKFAADNDRKWLRLLKEALPDDPDVLKAWHEYRASVAASA